MPLYPFVGGLACEVGSLSKVGRMPRFLLSCRTPLFRSLNFTLPLSPLAIGWKAKDPIFGEIGSRQEILE